MGTKSLHDLIITTDDGGKCLEDHSRSINSPSFDRIEVIFKNQEEKLLELINEYKTGAIFGCIAWLTSTPILKALSKCDNVQIVVQKEDFLRPDINVVNRDNWKNTLRNLYKSMKCGLDRYQFRQPICNLSICSDPTVDAIRCVGNHNSDKAPAFPRMHHKFLVFCKLNLDDYRLTPKGYYEPIDDKYEYEKKPLYIPVALWTGSFNLTKNATQSFENVLYFEDLSGNNEVINSFVDEHHQIFALSEPLDWESVWAEPEFRIGT